MSVARRFGLVFAIVVSVMAIACSGGPDDAWRWDLPQGFPEPRVPDDNPMSAARVELGRHLFHDTRLSGNGTQACASCHRQELAFSDGRVHAVGSTGARHRRNSMSLANVAYASRLTWANPHLDRLEGQALIPMFGDDPVELGMPSDAELVRRLTADEGYVQLFAAAFPDEPEPIRVDNVTRALGSFQRTLISGRSAYDRYAQGDSGALSASALRGMELFFSERLECFHCHGGFNFADSVDHARLAEPERAFHNTALYNVDGQGAYPARDRGLMEITGDPADMGRFKAPTLRNIAVTAPYMHDGSVPALEEAIEHYARGGRTVATGPDRGVGSESPLKDEFVVGFVLRAGEREDLLAFLHSLTDEEFLRDPRFAAPVRPGDASRAPTVQP
jgi:cytochrome c peroxidase